MNHYETLGVQRDASPEDIKDAYKRLCLQHHPDRSTGNEEVFKGINEAYETLSDPDKRAVYDAGGYDWDSIVAGRVVHELTMALGKSINEKPLPDLIKEAKASADRSIAGAERSIAVGTRNKDKLEAMIGRVETDSPRDLFRETVMSNLESIRQSLEAQELELRMFKAVRAELDKYRDQMALRNELVWPTTGGM